MEPTRVYIVDDHELVRMGLRSVVESDGDMRVVGEAATGEDALEGVPAASPDVVLLDLRMPGIGGVETCRRLLEAHHELRVLVLTSYDDDDDIFGVLSAGAAGYLMKDTSPEALLQSVRAVADGQTVLDPGVARRVIAARRPERSEQPEAPVLSARETEVLELMARGWDNRSIARELWISEPTVKSHVSHVLRKLGVSDRTHAVVRAVRLGLVRIPPAERGGSSS